MKPQRPVVCTLASMVLFCLSYPASGQTPEHARLSLFEGFWVFTGRLGGIEYGVAGANTHTESCQLIGSHFVACQYEVNAPASPYSGIGIVGYDAEDHSYSFTSYDSRGTITRLRAPVQADRWVWEVGSNSRVVWEQLSPTAYAYRAEARDSTGGWRAVSEGRYDKVRAK